MRLRLGPVLAALLAMPAAAATFTNPLLDSGPDPWIVQDGGTYYYMNTSGDRIDIRRTKDIADLVHAATKTVWRAPADGPRSAAVWAPELPRIAGKWYLYFTAADKAHNDDDHRRIYVLENAAADPLDGEWIDRGMLKTGYTGIDGTVFADGDKLWFAYSAYVGPDSHLVLAEMKSPWELSAKQVDIAGPTYDWEKRGGRQILEGPEFLKGPLGHRFLVYSASACWSDDYALGMLTAAPGADLADPKSWTKSPAPVFKKSEKNGVYAPGHNGFFKSPDGREDWIVYHANPGPGMECTKARSPRIQKFGWMSTGFPDFGEPAPPATPLPEPSYLGTSR
jgi:GH43 family beta-xylosidase